VPGECSLTNRLNPIEKAAELYLDRYLETSISVGPNGKRGKITMVEDPQCYDHCACPAKGTVCSRAFGPKGSNFQGFMRHWRKDGSKWSQQQGRKSHHKSAFECHFAGRRRGS
jgi:hypothetical protein